jgi:ABC-type sugar transport system ATPase subunit
MAVSVSVSRLNKRYGGTHALRDVSLACEEGDVHAIAGENGAGKSTLVKVLSGVIPANEYAGEVRLSGELVEFSGVRDAERAGIFLVPQELQVIPELSVADYLYLNREPRRFGMVDRRKLWSDTSAWLASFRLSVSPMTPMGELSSHEQQLVSIARAMTQGVKVLILDEPTASLTGRETELLFDELRALRQRRVTTLYISHRLAELERIADAVTVMRDGSVVDNFRMADDSSPARRIIRGMIGQDVEEMYPKGACTPGDKMLQLTDWTVENPLPDRPPLVENLSLELRAGEVLGVFGLIGSGASDLVRSVYGIHRGKVRGIANVQGKGVTLRNAREAMACGIAYLPSDRKREGLVLGMSVGSNLTLAGLNGFAELGAVVDRKQEAHAVRDYIRNLRIKCASPDQAVGDLSGGNQQKVVAAKCLLTHPKVLLLEEPTRGVDVGARLEIYELVNKVAAEGRAVVLVSTDVSEVLGISDRVIAMRDGRFAGEWTRGEVSEENLMLHAAGGVA